MNHTKQTRLALVTSIINRREWFTHILDGKIGREKLSYFDKSTIFFSKKSPTINAQTPSSHFYLHFLLFSLVDLTISSRHTYTMESHLTVSLAKNKNLRVLSLQDCHNIQQGWFWLLILFYMHSTLGPACCIENAPKWLSHSVTFTSGTNFGSTLPHNTSTLPQNRGGNNKPSTAPSWRWDMSTIVATQTDKFSLVLFCMNAMKVGIKHQHTKFSEGMLYDTGNCAPDT